VPLPVPFSDLLENLSFFEDRTDRIQALISLADRFEPTSRPKPYPEAHRVPGCESEAFVWVDLDAAGKLVLEFAVENPQGISAMTLAVALKESLEGADPAVAQQIPDEVIYDLFGKELSMGKSMGLMGMVRLTKYLAARA
jgi:cysteine desulfuration protein SufE